MSDIRFCACGCGKEVSNPKWFVFRGHSNKHRDSTLFLQGPLQLCACGCGNPVARITSRYLHGHSSGTFHGHPAKRFWSKVKKTDTCWLWQGQFINSGYGQFRINDKHILAHHFAWILFHGSIPEGLQVHHNCPGYDNKACVNPEHLWIGTQKENVSDCIQKNHFRITSTPDKQLRGSRNSAAKLTEEQVEQMWLLRQTLRNATIARMFGVSKTTVGRIFNGQYWKHVSSRMKN